MIGRRCAWDRGLTGKQPESGCLPRASDELVLWTELLWRGAFHKQQQQEGFVLIVVEHALMDIPCIASRDSGRSARILTPDRMLYHERRCTHIRSRGFRAVQRDRERARERRTEGREIGAV
eukprot:GHVU01141734.1.p1 GENE.GHVU01141734.1~~GHVU01141734.1.p1  ORF type:complete len:121 (-),score=9.16 GHVU01141734.1:33-395(-)